MQFRKKSIFLDEEELAAFTANQFSTNLQNTGCEWGPEHWRAAELKQRLLGHREAHGQERRWMEALIIHI